MDKKYWEEYYTKDLAPHEPSLFATFALTHLTSNQTLLELGCGNGRDSIFFTHHNLRVTAIDQTESAIAKLQQTYNNIEFLKDDFVSSSIYHKRTFDNVYSRFTMHTITLQEQAIVFANIHSALREGGTFFIEVRTVNDDIYGKGVCVGMHEYVYEDHYRRFVEKNAFEDSLLSAGFTICYSEERTGFSPLKNSDPMLLRVVAQKPFAK